MKKEKEKVTSVTHGSYRFLDPEFKTFSTLLSKTIIINNYLFFQTQGHQIGDQYRPFIFLKNAGMKFFSQCTANTRVRLNKT